MNNFEKIPFIRNSVELARKLGSWCEKHGIDVIEFKDFAMWHRRATSTHDLGSGAYGSCYLLKFCFPMSRTKNKYVVKQFTGEDEALPELMQEVFRLHTCQQVGVQHLVGICPLASTLITRYAGRDLETLIEKNLLNEEQRVHVLCDIMRVTGTNLKRKIAHTDIREANICVKRQKVAGRIKVSGTLIDFGLAVEVGEQPFSDNEQTSSE